MTEKRFEIVGENFTNVDVATYIVEYGDGDDDCFELYESKEDSQKVCDKLNNILDENEQLKQRNTNQYNQLTELWQIIEEENWEKLIAMKKQLKEDEERLQKEWVCYE